MIDNSRVKNHLFFGFVEKACAEHVFSVLLQAYNKRPDLIDAPWVESAALVPGCCYTGFAMEVMSPVSTPERRVHNNSFEFEGILVCRTSGNGL
jgi:hypothetical protein